MDIKSFFKKIHLIFFFYNLRFLFTLVIEFQSSVWKILVANDSNVTNWQEHKLVCNCPFYLKNNLCKHNMALAAALKFVNIPLEARSLPMESKPKRGRRSQATKALLVQ